MNFIGSIYVGEISEASLDPISAKKLLNVKKQV